MPGCLAAVSPGVWTLPGFGKEAVLSLFIQFLCAEKQVPAGRVAAYGKWQPGSREPFGSIALRYGLLTMIQVDEVLAKKERLERFGETASRLKYLRSGDVENILMIQSLCDLDDFIGWALVHKVLAGDDLVGMLRDFWTWLEAHKPTPWARAFAACRSLHEAVAAGANSDSPT